MVAPLSTTVRFEVSLQDAGKHWLFQQRVGSPGQGETTVIAMSDFQQQLRDATSKNQELLLVLSQTDYARPALKQTTAYITDLTSQIAAADKELQRLRHVTQDERKDHVKYRDRLVY